MLQYRYLFLLFIQLSSFPLLAQVEDDIIQVQSNSDADNLVKDIFIKGTCKNVNNIVSSGSPQSFGVFQNAATIIGFSEGIILSTGDVKSAVGPNTSVETSTQFTRSSLDKDLTVIATDQLFDVTVLEFDFIPIEAEVTFQYVFASEEYCEFVGTNFNDVFGFFVSGPGINGPFSGGAINVARLPGSDEFVSINTVNHETNQNSYVKNELRDDIDNCNIDFNPGHLFTFEYDGFTIPLLARIPVIPCETYHIRLVVGDVGDDKLDSAVFLRSKSFDLGAVATVEAVVPDRTDPVAFENCLDGQFVFTRPDGSFNFNPLVVEFEIDASSTALAGVDFSDIPNTITIPSRENTAVLNISTLFDGLTEDIESLTLNLNLFQACECIEGDNATLKIMDAIPPDVLFSPSPVCAGQAFTIMPEITNGVPPFSFEWSNRSTDMNLQATIQTPTKFNLTVTDFCNNQVIDSVQIEMQEKPTADLSGVIDYCEGLDDIILPINFNGQAPWSFTYQVNNDTPISIEDIFDRDFDLPVEEAGTYQLIEFKDAACTGDANGMAVVNDINIELGIQTIAPFCPNANDAEIILNIMGSPPYDITWMPLVNDVAHPTNLSSGVYDLFIRDAQNCERRESVVVENPSIITLECLKNTVYIPNAFSPNGDGNNDLFEIFIPDPTIAQRIQKVEIFDRWGSVVYVADGEMPQWDGRFRGKKLNPGLFTYVIEVELNIDKSEFLQGSLNLIR